MAFGAVEARNVGLLIVVLLLGSSCGSGNSRDDLKARLLVPNDISDVEGSFVIAQDAPVTGPLFSQLSGDLLRLSMSQSAVQINTAYERTIEGYSGQPILERGWPSVLYEVVLSFSSSPEAEKYFQSAIGVAGSLDWLRTNPIAASVQPLTNLSIEHVASKRLNVASYLWLNVTATGPTPDDRLFDDVILFRTGDRIGMLRIPGYTQGALSPYPANYFESKFEEFAVKLAGRIKDD